MIAMVRPFLGQRAVRNLRVEPADHNCCAGFRKWRRTATGIEV
jgi:hypothetical protein